MTLVETLRDSPHDVARIIDHTNVDPTATVAEIDALCQEVVDHGFRSAVVVPYHTARVADHIGDQANVVPVVGFPYGLQTTAAKQAELDAVLTYADEIDMVINRTAFANQDYDAVVADIAAITDYIGDRPLKCIIEAPDLTTEEIATAAQLVEEGGAAYVKTAVGYEGPTDPATVRTIRDAVSDDMRIKASGGIGTFEEALAMVDAGASRIGASSGVAILESIAT